MSAKATVRRMYEVKSSQIHKVGYDPIAFYLCVQFKNLAVYGYEGVDHETFCRLMNAESIGVYFTDFVKDHHECEKLKSAPKRKATAKKTVAKKKPAAKKKAPKRKKA